MTFERYADDAVVHCVTERQARQVQEALTERLAGLGLQLHPEKTKIVYCKDDKRRGAYGHTSFTFLGYTFQPRGVVGRNGDRLYTLLQRINTYLMRWAGRKYKRAARL